MEYYNRLNQNLYDKDKIEHPHRRDIEFDVNNIIECRGICEINEDTEVAEFVSIDNEEDLDEEVSYPKSNRELYYDFLDELVSCVVSKVKFRQAKTEMVISKFVTISDEAFALVCLLNSYNCWCQMYLTNDMRKTSHVGTRSKYTNSGNAVLNGSTNDSDEECGSTRRYCGWSEAGLKKYNELYDAVEAD